MIQSDVVIQDEFWTLEACQQPHPTSFLRPLSNKKEDSEDTPRVLVCKNLPELFTDNYLY